MTLRLFSVTEAAHATGRSVKTIRRLYDDGTLTGPKVGRKRLISEDSLIAWAHPSKADEPPVEDERHFADIVTEDRFA